MENKKNYSLIPGVMVLLAIIAVIAVAGYFVSRPKPMVIQGEVEASDYRVSGKVPGRIELFYAVEGQKVHKGDTVVLIDSPEIRAKLAQARGAVNAAKAQNAKAAAGARQEQITAAYELWQQALVQEDIMLKSFNRVSRLFEQKVVAEQKYDEAKARYDAAVAQSKAAKSQYDMAINGATREDRAAAAALVERAAGAMQEVEGYLPELYLVSPADGIVSEIFPKVGELVGTGAPIMTVTDLSDLWFTFNVREDMMNGLRQGSPLKVRIPALGDAMVDATVSFIAVRQSYATWRATKETGGYDAKTFEVRAVPNVVTEGLLPGMTAILAEY
ncbi:MAG: efflux RND transporter periplasmic adaptor subunit [Bacteroidales bacterium]|nr:efflux RND transporter periplasmic adaptor subunit [Bacteroidales bacterium]